MFDQCSIEELKMFDQCSRYFSLLVAIAFTLANIAAKPM
jgi:hypothetical protein